MGRRQTCVAESPQIGAANGTADRAVRILQVFTEERPVWTVQEVATHFAMPRSTTYRYLNSLRAAGLVVEDGRRGFHLGPGVFKLARAATAGTSVVRLAAPHLWRLADTFGAKVGLHARVGAEIVPLDILDGSGASTTRRRSRLLPWPGTCVSKILLAFTPEPERSDLLQRMVPTTYTDKTVADYDGLLKALADIRRLGYHISDEEIEKGAWGVGAPVYSQGEARYCIALAVPKARANQTTAAALITAVQLAATQLSAELADTEFEAVAFAR